MYLLLWQPLPPGQGLRQMGTASDGRCSSHALSPVCSALRSPPMAPDRVGREAVCVSGRKRSTQVHSEPESARANASARHGFRSLVPRDCGELPSWAWPLLMTRRRGWMDVHSSWEGFPRARGRRRRYARQEHTSRGEEVTKEGVSKKGGGRCNGLDGSGGKRRRSVDTRVEANPERERRNSDAVLLAGIYCRLSLFPSMYSSTGGGVLRYIH
ncbi:hypothetical protein K431DRAFT_93178 [Polychaeton citri CBS 116435]|uniref:Uncharacterized protein n=1 Tax=Polychaeton citri CBS 116435 TaxID=1314669 RepID=A0A9P4UPE2_9PEZI|nr:hypothetical protein K431DRAFT_93178 [Polychaeton citri CBS 116435]